MSVGGAAASTAKQYMRDVKLSRGIEFELSSQLRDIEDMSCRS